VIPRRAILLALCGGLAWSQGNVGPRPITCLNPGPFMSIAVAEPPGTSSGPVARVRLRCVPLDPAVFHLDGNGFLTITLPVPTFAYTTTLVGPIDSTGLKYSLSTLPAPGQQIAILINPQLPNGGFLTTGVDYSVSPPYVTFFSPNRNPRPGDTIVVLYLTVP
jgi:hypothetical protein